MVGTNQDVSDSKNVADVFLDFESAEERRIYLSFEHILIP